MTIELQEIIQPIYPQPGSGEKYQVGREFQAQIDSNWTFSLSLNNDVQSFKVILNDEPYPDQIMPLTKPILGLEYFRCDACSQGRCDTQEARDTVKCEFMNSKPNSTHICYSGYGNCLAGRSCGVSYDGPVLKNVEWKSDCAGVAYTKTDAIAETVQFDCSKQAADFKCIDTDNGIYYAVQGSCLTKNGALLTDKCAPWNSTNSRDLYECTCKGENANYTVYKCPFSCMNGACIR
jgi:hypothetical protein